VSEFLSERQLPVAPETFAMGVLLNELNGVSTASHSHGMSNDADTFSVIFIQV